jgi:hypothetical protein
MTGTAITRESMSPIRRIIKEAFEINFKIKGNSRGLVVMKN